jgi:hypothetical protein
MMTMMKEVKKMM